MGLPRRPIPLALAPAVVAAAILLLSSGAGAWQTEIDGAGTDGGLAESDRAFAVAVDPVGDVVAAGTTLVGGGTSLATLDFAFTVVKLGGAAGNVLWRREFDGTAPPPDFDQALSVAVDPSGDVVAAGLLHNAISSADFVVMKLSGVDGSLVWRKTVDVADGFDRAVAVALDARGDVIAAGQLHPTRAGEGGTDLAVIGLGGLDGVERWRRVVAGSRSGGTDQATAVTVDPPSGDALVAGIVDNLGHGIDLWVMRVDGATGAQVFGRAMDGPVGARDLATGVAWSPTGSLRVAGSLEGLASANDFTVAGLTGAGALSWTRSVDGSGRDAFPEIDLARAVAFTGSPSDPAGTAFAAGELVQSQTGPDFALIKLRPDGTEAWRRVLDGGVRGADAATALGIRADGDPVVAGRLTSGAGTRMAVARFDRGDGSERWRHETGGSGGASEAEAVALDAAGDVIVAGFVARAGRGQELTVIKRRGVDGADFTPGDGDGDGIPDHLDPCPALGDGSSADADGDGVGDGCDNCRRVANPRLAGPPVGHRTTGGQIDDDLDGVGNACDADFTAAGFLVTVGDLARMREAQGQPVTATMCPDPEGLPRAPCAQYDLDGRGANVDEGDLARAIELQGTVTADEGCAGTACPLPCQSGIDAVACP